MSDHTSTGGNYYDIAFAKKEAAMPNHKDEFNPNADEALILKNIEDIQARVNNLLTQVRNFLKRIG